MNVERRLFHLEALRGVASIIVVAHHFFLAFDPTATGFLGAYRNGSSWIGSPFFFLVNGQGAVIFFFVLSGFVLPLSAFRGGNKASIASGVIKRLPRLYLPVALAIMLSWLFFRLGLYSFVDAARLSGSTWLADFGYVGMNSFIPSLGNALRETATVFASGGSKFDGVLWTMRPELLGSFAVFALAAMLMLTDSRAVRIVLCLLAVVVSFSVGYYTLPFICGTCLAALICTDAGDLEIGVPAAVACLGVGLFLMSYVVPLGAFQWLAGPMFYIKSVVPDASLEVNAIGALLVIFAVQQSAGIRSLLSGRVGVILGRYSFPLYLVHCVAIFSVASYQYVVWSQHGWNQAELIAGTASVTAVASVLLATPFVFVDLWWTGLIAKVVRRFVSKSKEEASASRLMAPATTR